MPGASPSRTAAGQSVATSSLPGAFLGPDAGWGAERQQQAWGPWGWHPKAATKSPFLYGFLNTSPPGCGRGLSHSSSTHHLRTLQIDQERGKEFPSFLCRANSDLQKSRGGQIPPCCCCTGSASAGRSLCSPLGRELQATGGSQDRSHYAGKKSHGSKTMEGRGGKCSSRIFLPARSTKVSAQRCRESQRAEGQGAERVGCRGVVRGVRRGLLGMMREL